MSNKKQSKMKAFKIGAYSVILSAIVLAVVIALNLLVSLLPTSLIHIDSTPEKVLSVGDETKEILRGLEDDITFYHIAQTGKEDSYITEMLRRYEEAGSHIKIKTVDPVSRPNFTSQFTSQEVPNNSVIVVSEKRNTVVSTDDIYMYELSGYDGQYLTGSEYENYVYQCQAYGMTPPEAKQLFFAENALTRAVDYVRRDELPVIYTLSGHGETDFEFGEICVSENVELKTLALQGGDTTEIPDDASAVIINAPQVDIGLEECETLRNYIDNGGTVILTTNFQYYSAAAMPNLASICKAMGLTAIESLIVEDDKDHYTGYINNLLPDITGNGMTSLMQSTNYYFYMPASHAITTVEDATGVETYALLTTSESAFAYTEEIAADPDKAKEAEHMQYTVAYQSTVSDESGKKGGSLIWMGSPYAFSSGYARGSGNSLFFTAILQDMSSNSSAISLIGKNISPSYLTATVQTVYTWFGVMCVAVPLFIIIVGVVVWIRRRRR